jgi:arylsulfatase A-like enzyme
MNRLAVASPLVWLALALSAHAAETAPNRMNVLMIAIDDLRPTIGCYGDPNAITPHMDRLAARGLRFERAYCQQALCSPSRISLLSGRRPSTSKVYSIGPTLRSAMPDITTLPQHFKNEGYFTRSLGKVYHVGIDDPASWSVPSEQGRKPRVGPRGQRLQRERRESARREGTTIPEKSKGALNYAGPAFEAVDCGDDDLLDGDCARRAVEVLHDLAGKPQQPFFFAVGFANPHVPWVAPRKYFDLYDPSKLVIADNTFVPRDAPDFAAKSGDDFYWYADVPQDRRISEPYGRECLQAYLAATSYIDAQVGRLLQALDDTGLAKNTVVILWGDHGYYMGEHSWWGGKHNNYEGATNTLLLCAVPNQKTAGRATKGIVEFVDIYPTLVELCGLPQPKDGLPLEGQSFAPLLESPDRPWKTAAFSEYPKGGLVASGQRVQMIGRAMATVRYRYVEWTNTTTGAIEARELYDHQADPKENQNIAPTADASLLDSLSQQMKGYWQAARAQP